VLNRHLGGTMPLYVMLSGDREGYFQQASALAALDTVEKELMREPEVGYTYSLAGFIRRMNHVIHDDNRDYERIPYEREITYVPAAGPEQEETAAGPAPGEMIPIAIPGSDLIAQYVVLYESSGGDDIRDVADASFQETNMMVLLKSDRSSVAERVMERVQELTEQHFGTDVQVRFSGYAEVAASTTREVVDSQSRAMWYTIAAVYALLLVYYRSIVHSLLALLPLGMAILFNLGTMAVLDLSLNIGSAIVLTMSIGLGVDFAIHFLSRYRQEASDASLSAAIMSTMSHAGKAIVINLLVLSQGFSALTMSGFTAIRDLGILIVLTTLWTALASILVLPALAVRFPVVHTAEVTSENIAAEAEKETT
jgi:predicted RND superfamily exporter protein